MKKITINPWWTVAVAVVILAYNMGARQALGLMLPDINLNLGVSLSELSFGFAVQNLLWGVVSPLAGILAERYGTVRVLVGGTVLYSLGLLVAAIAQSGLLFFVGNALLVGLGVGATTFPIVLAAVGKRFPVHKRTFALGIASAGGSLGQFIYSMLVGELNPQIGWSNTYTLFAASGVLVLCLCWVLAEEKVATSPRLNETKKLFDWSVIRQALGMCEYQLLNVGFFVCGFHIAFITVHMAGFVAYCGLLPGVASGALALVGIVNIAGVIFFGWAGDRWHKPWLLVLIYWLRACLIIMLLLLPKTETLVYVFAALMGMLWLSTVPLTSGAVAQIFGTKNLASLFGIVMLSHQLGAFIGSWWSGLVFEWYGSYDMALIASALLGLLAAAVHIPLTPARMKRISCAG